MFFYIAKLGLLLFQPSSLLVLVMLAGTLLSLRARSARIGRALAISAAMGFALLGFLPLSNVIVRPLEERFPPADLAAIGPRVAGIVILGGFEDTWVSRGRGALALTDAAERLTDGVRLAQRLPQAKVVFTGGTGDLFETEGAADIVAEYLVAFGIAPDRIVLERKSRTTAENAALTRDIVRPKPGEVWLLVTSAQHMPRSVGVFRAAGFEVAAWPVDFRTSGSGDEWRRGFTMASEGLRRADYAAREWYGLFGYWLSGRSTVLFPAP